MKNKKGIALLTIIVFIFTLTIMGATFLSLINIDVVEFNHQYQNVQAKYVAESGIAKALWYLNSQISPTTSSEDIVITSLNNKLYKIGNYSTSFSGGKIKQIISYGNVKKEQVIISISAKDEDPHPERVNYRFLPGTWKREK